MKGKLEDIAGRTGLSKEDAKRIRFGKHRVAYLLGGALLALIAFIIGLLLGWFLKKDTGGGSGGGGYPYAVSSAGVVASFGQRPSRILLLLATLSAFAAGFTAPVFGQSIDYGVYRRSGDQ